MITVREAKQAILNHTISNEIIEIELTAALNRYLAEDLFSPVELPFFNQSAVDGYAFLYNKTINSYSIVDEVAAGDTRRVSVKKNEAVRIFTGSKVPEGCDTVIMQEFTTVKNNTLYLNDTKLTVGGNVRLKGYQIKKSELILKKGTKITAAAIGFLSSLGYTHIKIVKLPKVKILVTGNELVKPGNKLKEGQIYESNSEMLKAAFLNWSVDAEVEHLNDNLEATINAIKNALAHYDFIVISGGISVGDYDFVKESLLKNEVEEIFYKVNQKPGKPLFFGIKGTKNIFALPGNPAAALTCFYQYVAPALKYKMGNANPFSTIIELPVSETIYKKEDRAHFYKAITDFKTVTPLGGQNSDALQSFVWANCLLFLKEGVAEIKKGFLVEVHLLD